MNNKNRGESNFKWGKEAEQIASEYLISKGYTILERNWKAGTTIEIDLIAQIGTTVVFVEVKARKGDFINPEDTVNKAKMNKMVKGGDIFLSSLPHTFEYRLDVITITGTPDNYKIRHIPDAFLPPVTGA